MRTIMHVDLDAFFASCEQREKPEYKGKPLVVGADPKEGKGRGVVSTCSYEARKYGIKSGIPISRAYHLCPVAIFVKPNFSLYKKSSQNVMKIISKYCHAYQQVGVDEAYMDVTGLDYEKIAKQLKKEIFEAENLTCSVGIGSNRLIAKVASDYEKPDGVTIVPFGKEKEFLDPLPIRDLRGVGEKMEVSLKQIGIQTIGDLARKSPESMVKRFGKWGLFLQMKANGVGSDVIGEYGVRKSMSKEITFPEDTRDEAIINATMEMLAKKLHSRLVENKFACKTIGVRIRYSDFTTHTKEKTVQLTENYETISKIQKNLVEGFMEDDRPIRLVGARLSGLEEMSTKQLLMGEFF